MTARIASRPAPTTRGVLYVHSAPSALCPHIEWAVGGVLGVAVSLEWTPQPAQAGTYRAELSWAGERRHRRRRSPRRCAAGTTCASRSPRSPTVQPEGARFSYTPDLGVFHAVTGLHGDIMIPEDRLKAAVVKAALGDTTLLGEIDKLLGKPWDDELETVPARRRRRAGPLAAPGRLSSRHGRRCAQTARERRRAASRRTHASGSERDVAVRPAAHAVALDRASMARAIAERVAAGSTTSSTTPISTALSTPPAIRSCSAASSASTCGRMSGATSASLRRCRIRIAATAPITATSAPGQANTLVAPSEREFIAM